jgi:hypothetical protein
MSRSVSDSFPLVRIVPAGRPTTQPEPRCTYEAGPTGRAGDGRLLLFIERIAGEQTTYGFIGIADSRATVLTSAQLEAEPLRPVALVPVDEVEARPSSRLL